MQVHEIAKKAGLESSEVAKALGIEGKGFALKTVEDEVAEEYLASLVEAEVEQPPKQEAPSLVLAVERAKTARFWCKNQYSTLASRDDESRKTIKFDEWAYECPADSLEAKLCRRDDSWAKFGVAEILSEPYGDDGVRLDFLTFIESRIYTGHTHAEGPSRKGMNSIIAMLPPAVANNMNRKARNDTRTLALELSKRISLNVTSFG